MFLVQLLSFNYCARVKINLKAIEIKFVSYLLLSVINLFLTNAGVSIIPLSIGRKCLAFWIRPFQLCYGQSVFVFPEHVTKYIVEIRSKVFLLRTYGQRRGKIGSPHIHNDGGVAGSNRERGR